VIVIDSGNILPMADRDAHEAAPLVLVADDEQDFREDIASFLRTQGFRVATASSGEEALALAQKETPAAVLADVRMPKLSGLALLGKLHELQSSLPVLLMTAYASVETAVSALRGGAADYLLKPVEPQTVLAKLRVTLARAGRGAASPEARAAFPDLVAESPAMRRVLELIAQVAPTVSTLLLTGESGTGKEVVARAIHRASPRAAEPFVAINLGALPDQLVESELFGFAKGAFSGAQHAKRGLFEVAERGTLFLDEVGDVPLAFQVKLLRAIERKETRPLGTTDARTIDVRIIAATNRDLRALVAQGLFREDFYYRLNVFEVQMPPLRERREDIRPLAEHFLRRTASELAKPARGISPAALVTLQNHPWPGNVRELEHRMMRAVLLAKGEELAPEDLALGPPAGEGAEVDDLRAARAAFERRHVRRVLEKFGGDKQKAAIALGVDLSSLYRKLEDKT
jgi:DNA-binding NtrC family response regulator